MSVDFFDCTICGKSVCKCGEYSYCGCCERNFCKECYKYPASEDETGGWEEYISECKIRCPICSEKIVLDEELVHFLLDKLDLTREEAEELYRKEAK